MRATALLIACVATALSLTAAPAHAAGALQFRKIQYDSPGSDRGSKASLNAEYIVIKNTGSTARSLTGWTVRDAQNHIYTFGKVSLGAGKSHTLHMGKGTDTTSNRYWGESWYVWNNSGDKATLRNSSGTTMDSCTWTAVGAGYKNC